MAVALPDSVSLPGVVKRGGSSAEIRDTRYESRDTRYPASHIPNPAIAELKFDTSAIWLTTGIDVAQRIFLQESTEITEMNSALFPQFSPVRNKRRERILCKKSYRYD